ncbi:MAG: 2-oxoacid:ferredoxin oxidoreductase subunit beta [Desulfurococcales archaeon]|nr:2-oxoacid:ferredoxin oxidoreductase subunit beta [Desulfurococcales archaeon]
MSKAKHFTREYVREEVLPTAFCPGCYNGVVMNALALAFKELGVRGLRNYVFVSGIGCSSWIPSPYIKADSVHTLHGRAVAVATGIKLVRPDLNVVVIAGDGDLAAIGGNHLIHAARRNMDLIVIMVNNLVYGMTRGQQSPTTPHGKVTLTTPYGNFEMPFDIAGLLTHTNANYVARWCVSNFTQLKESIKEVLTKYSRGFRFIEVWAPCITYVVRYEGKTPGEKLKEMREVCVPVSKYEGLSGEEKVKYVAVGVFKKEDKPGFIELYREYVARAGGAHNE